MNVEAVAPSWSELYRRPTRHEAQLALTRQFAGPYPGPNRVVLAALLAEHLLNFVERDGGAWWADT